MICAAFMLCAAITCELCGLRSMPSEHDSHRGALVACLLIRLGSVIRLLSVGLARAPLFHRHTLQRLQLAVENHALQASAGIE